MKRNTLNFWIDLASFLAFFALFLTGLLIHYVLPPCDSCTGAGCTEDKALTLWGLGRHDFGKVHFYLALTISGAILIHVCLHWSWVCATSCTLFGLKRASADRQKTYGTVILIILVILIITLLYLAKTQAK
ncbi:MAG: DUF4405 domain-containing protein [Phycisphaerae bacterium]|nr:DUF4405 domain-containing protein [Phycisphaerae bacterium]